MSNIQVAIDGPAGSGKSSISKLIAKKIGFVHIDTGAMFRAITLYALNNNIDLDDEEQYDFLDSISISYDNDKIFLNQVDVTKEIRSDIVTNNVSTVSKLKVVRDKMIDLERQAAQNGKILMDGRDIGSVVLPNATVKIFLTASVSERAKRRYKELLEKGRTEISLEDVEKDIIARDYKDSTREIAPLKQAEDAILVDTTSLTIDEVCEKIINIIKNKVGLKMVDMNKDVCSMEDVSFSKEVKKGDVVLGTVVLVKDNEAYLDIKQPSEGKIFLDHYTSDKNVTSLKQVLKDGDSFLVEITSVKHSTQGYDDHTVILCSRKNLIKAEAFKDLKQLFEENKRFEVIVTKETDKGYFVNYKEFSLFMPKNASVKGVKVNDKLTVVLLSIDKNRLSGVVSSKQVYLEDLEAAKEQELNAINVDDVITAKVVKILPFACFLEYGKLQLRLNLADISHTYIKSIDEVLKVNDEVTVKVIEKTNNKVIVSRKALLKTPFELFAQDHKVGDTIEAKVVSKLPYGLLLEVAPNVKGLLHSSEYSWNPNDNFNNCVNIDDTVVVAIIELNKEANKIRLSKKALIDNPWSRVEAKRFDLVKAKIVEVNENNLVVETLGVNGTISFKDALSAEQNGKLADYYSVSDEVEAIIVDIRPREWVLKLSITRLAKMREQEETQKLLDENNLESANISLGDLLKELDN